MRMAAYRFFTGGWRPQPIHSQPPRPLRRRRQILWITAPGKIRQSLLRLQQLGARWIQVHIITHRLEVPVAAPIHDQGPISAAEQMSKLLSAAIKPAGVNAQQPL